MWQWFKNHPVIQRILPGWRLFLKTWSYILFIPIIRWIFRMIKLCLLWVINKLRARFSVVDKVCLKVKLLIDFIKPYYPWRLGKRIAQEFWEYEIKRSLTFLEYKELWSCYKDWLWRKRHSRFPIRNFDYGVIFALCCLMVWDPFLSMVVTTLVSLMYYLNYCPDDYRTFFDICIVVLGFYFFVLHKYEIHAFFADYDECLWTHWVNFLTKLWEVIKYIGYWFLKIFYKFYKKIKP